jgi:hypothetical protein
MARFRPIFIVLLIFIYASLVIPAAAQSGIQLVSDKVALLFPDTATFQAEFKSSAAITSVVLEYGVDQLTCGTVIAKAYPQLTASTDVQVQWAWDMRQSGSLPPGATLWWHWLVQDSNGAQFTSPRQTSLWLDSLHPWQVISGGNINLHYYSGGQSFGQTLHDSAAQALVRLSNDVGLQPDKPVDIYIYANTDDLKASVLYEPAWIGGQAYPEFNIVIIGISPDQLDWGKSTEAHELTHVLVGHLTFSCLGFIPTWLNEGLAMYGEGGPASAELAQFDTAKASNQLPSLESLSGGFSEESDRATLSYTEAFSVVNFMIQKYGRAKMTALLLALKNGETIDQGLNGVYAFDTNGLENAWRASIGAASISGSANATPVPIPTEVPTIIPVGAAPLPQADATNVAGSTSPQSTTEMAPTLPAPAAISTPIPTTPATSLAERLGINRDVLFWVEIGLACCVLVILVVAVPVIVTTRRHGRRK